MDELRLPPAPPAGAEVRARVLARVLDELDQAPARRDRPWLVPVAAAVAGVLVIGAAGGHRGCGAHAAVGGQRGQHPDRDPVELRSRPGGDGSAPLRGRRPRRAAVRGHRRHVRTCRRAPRPRGVDRWSALLCRATPTTVYLSEPSARRAVVGLGPGTVEVTVPAGSAVGVTSSSGVRTGLAAVNPDGSAQLLTFPADSYPTTVSASVQLFGESSTSTVTAADAPGALVVVDRPIPPADRTDPDGALLDECLAAEPQPIPDADAYRALGRLELPDGTVTVRALACGHAALCVQKDGRAALLALSTMYRFADGRLVVELERSVGADRVALLAVDPLATTVEADVDVGTRRPCRVESGVAFCLYESGGDPTVFVTRNAAGDIVGTGNP